MNATRKGKIARLPKAVREELNRRLEDGEKGRSLVAWLNTRPGSEAGNPIREQNLSEWKNGGYRDWLVQQEALEMARQLQADTRELRPAGGETLADQTAVWLTTRCLVAIRKLRAANSEGEPDLRVLRELCHYIVALRRGDHSAARLKIEQARLKLDQKETAEGAVEYFNRWKSNPMVREAIYGPPLSPEEKGARMRAIFGLAPEPMKAETPQNAGGVDQGAEK